MSTAKAYDEGLQGYRPSVGEHHDNCWSLWLEVMSRALDDLHGTKNWTPPDRIHLDALEWFISESHAIGSFRWTCSVFELNPEAVRKAIFERERGFRHLPENSFVYATSTNIKNRCLLA